jgi:hypothetical protein
MLPELGQWAITNSPSANFTSAMKRLYRLTRIPGMSSGQARPVDGVEFLIFFMEAHPLKTYLNMYAQII